MIGLRGSALLALTKFHGRKARTTVSIIVSSLLFALLAAALLITQGANQSINKFNGAGLGNRYIAMAQSDAGSPSDLLFSKEIIKNATNINKQNIAKRQAAAKKLGIPFDPQSLGEPVHYDTDIHGNKTGMLYITNSAAEQAITEYRTAHNLKYPDIGDLKQIATPYKPTNFYAINHVAPNNGQLTNMQNGQESFESLNPTSQSKTLFGLYGTFEVMDHSLIQSFLFKTQPGPNSGVPLVIKYADAENLLGFEPLRLNASATTVLKQIQRLYQKAEGYSFSACYRNTVSSQQIELAVSQKSMSKKELSQQPIIYDLPSNDSCGPVTVQKDNRTAAEKELDKKQKQFDKEFSQVVGPAQQKIKFYIAGLVPDPYNNGPANTASSILSNLLGASLYGQLIIPQNLYDESNSKAEVEKVLVNTDSNPLLANFMASYYVEFANDTSARNFIGKETCTRRVDGCATKQHPFEITAFGSNSLALQDMRTKTTKVLKLAFLIIIVLAAIIMSATVGRTITDSRRETAIFRAIGAKRSDISQIYLTYTICLSIFIAFFALALGLAAAYTFDHMFYQTVTVQAELDYGAATKGLTFHLFGWTNYIWLVALSCIVSGLLSIIWPLARNVRRNPIKDLREE